MTLVQETEKFFGMEDLNNIVTNEREQQNNIVKIRLLLQLV